MCALTESFFADDSSIKTDFIVKKKKRGFRSYSMASNLGKNDCFKGELNPQYFTDKIRRDDFHHFFAKKYLGLVMSARLFHLSLFQPVCLHDCSTQL